MATGTLTTYNLNVGIKLDVEDLIYIISPTDVPLQGSMGSDGRSALSSTTVFEKKYSWLDELLLTPVGLLSTTANTADTTITLQSAGAYSGNLNFQTGDVLLVGAGTTGLAASSQAESMLVNGYGTSANTLVVTRGFQSTTARIWTGGVTTNGVDTSTGIRGVGMALTEGIDPYAPRALDRVQRDNYTQIFGPTSVIVSGTENAVQKYGLSGTEFDKQVANRVKEGHISY